MPSLSILILVYSDIPESVRLYEKLKKENTDPNIHILVIDNHCTDPELLKASISPDDLKVNNTNLGYAGGNNAGINWSIEAGHEYIMVLNPDIEISIATIQSLINAMETEKEIAFIGPRICYRNDPHKIYSDGGIVEQHRGFRISHQNFNQATQNVASDLHKTDYVNGSAMIIRSKALKEFGLMREEFFMYFEETEWCLRAKDYGWKVMIDSRETAYHLSSTKGNRYQFLIRRNKIWLAKLRKEFVVKTIIDSILKVFILCLKRNKVAKRAHILGVINGILHSVKDHKKSNENYFKLK